MMTLALLAGLGFWGFIKLWFWLCVLGFCSAVAWESIRWVYRKLK